MEYYMTGSERELDLGKAAFYLLFGDRTWNPCALQLECWIHRGSHHTRLKVLFFVSWFCLLSFSFSSSFPTSSSSVSFSPSPQDDLDLLIFLPPPPQGQASQACVPTLIYMKLGVKPRAPCIPGKRFASWTAAFFLVFSP